MKRSYSTLGPVSTAIGDCLQVGTTIGFRASRELCSNFLSALDIVIAFVALPLLFADRKDIWSLDSNSEKFPLFTSFV